MIFGVFAALLGVALLGALRLQRVRVLVVGQANRALEGVFAGRLLIERVARISRTGVGGLDVTVRDLGGHEVLVARGASAQLAVLPLVWAVLVHPRDPIVIDLESVAIDHAELKLIDNGFGGPTLWDAFSPPRGGADASHAASPTLRIRSVEIGHVWIQGRLAAGPAVDAELRRALGRVDLTAGILRVQVDGVHVRTRGLPRGLDAEGEARGVIALSTAAPSSGDDPRGVASREPGPVAHAEFRGAVAGSSLTATFDWIDERLSASLDAPRIAPATLARVVPGALLRPSLALHATADGPLSEIRFDARVSVVDLPAAAPAPATLVVVGRAVQGEGAEVDAEIRAEKVDLAALVATAPASQIGALAHVHLTRTLAGVVAGTYAVSSAPGRLSGAQLPAVEVEGDLRRGEQGEISSKGHARVLEPGAHTTVDFAATIAAKPSESVISVESSTELSDPPRLRSLAQGLSARGSLDISARFWPGAGRFSAQSHARLRDVRQGAFGASRVDLRAEAAGGPHTPSGVLHLQARDIRAGEHPFRRLDVDANGTLARAHLSANLERDDAQSFLIVTEIGLRPTLFAQHTQVVLPLREGDVTLSVDDLRSSRGVIRVDGVHIAGIGTADASLAFGHELEQLDLSADSFDGARLARLLGVPSPFRTWSATLEAHYASRDSETEGFLRGRVSQAGIGLTHDATADLDLSLDRGQIAGTLNAQLAPGCAVYLSLAAFTFGMLERPDLALDSRDFSLTARAALDLARLEPWIGAFDLPLDHASGAVAFDLTARGPTEGREHADLLARLETRGLELAGPGDARTLPEVRGAAPRAQPWSVRGIDGKVDLTISGVRPRAEAFARLVDPRGTLVEARASVDLPASASGTWRLRVAEALRTPVAGRLHMPRRSLWKLPPMIRSPILRGSASLDGALGGTLENPRLVVDAAIERLSALKERTVGKEDLGLDVSIHAEGSRYGGNIRVVGKEQLRTVGTIDATFHGDILGLASASLDAPSPLQGDLMARFDRFPLGTLPYLYERQLVGVLTGDLALRDWGHNATLLGTFKTEHLGVGRFVVDRAEVGVRGANGQAIANVRLSGRETGTLEAEAATAMSWGDRLAPVLDPGIHGGLRATGLQIGVLSPFVSGSINEIEGSIDAQAEVALERGVPRLEGQATLSRGVLQIPSIGQRFESIGARLTIHDGDLRIEDLEARGLTGRVTGSAKARLEGLLPISGEAHVAIAQREEIPITIEGQAIGDAWGRADLTLERSALARTTKVRIDLPELHLDLPEVDPTALQDLAPAEHVRIGRQESDGRFVLLPVQPLANVPEDSGDALAVEVHLGRSVWIQKGPGIKVHVAGDLLARLGNRTTLDGRLELKGGKLDVSGKTFEIERGVVIFDGSDLDNPSVTATARFDSTGEYRVYAEYAGSVKDGKLTLRSEPPLSSDGIVSLLLFGTPEGSFGAGGGQGSVGDSTAAAVGLAGGTAAKGLNRALSVLPLDVSARLDTSTGTARPELDVRLTPRLTARMARAIGDPAFGQSPDRTFLTLELRLRRSWALSAVVGDRGASALDLLWRRRY